MVPTLFGGTLMLIAGIGACCYKKTISRACAKDVLSDFLLVHVEGHVDSDGDAFVGVDVCVDGDGYGEADVGVSVDIGVGVDLHVEYLHM